MMDPSVSQIMEYPFDVVEDSEQDFIFRPKWTVGHLKKIAEIKLHIKLPSSWSECLCENVPHLLTADGDCCHTGRLYSVLHGGESFPPSHRSLHLCSHSFPSRAKPDPRDAIFWEDIFGGVTKNSKTWQLVWEELCEKPLKLGHLGQSLEQLHEEFHRHILEFLDDVFDFLKNLQDELTHFVKLSRLWSEFPCNRRHFCTTMPWTIWPALVVLWGVCWMFIVGFSEQDFIDPSLLPMPEQDGGYEPLFSTQPVYGSQPLSPAAYFSDVTMLEYAHYGFDPENHILAPTASQFSDNTLQVPSAGSTRALEMQNYFHGPTTTPSQPRDTATAAATTTILPFAQTARETPAHQSLPPVHPVFPHQNHSSEPSPPQSHADSLKCPQCERTFTRKSSLKRHLQQLHGPPQQQPVFFCPNHKCKRSGSAGPPKPFTRQSHVDRHLKTCVTVLNSRQSPSHPPSQPDELPDAGPSQLEVEFQVPPGLQDMQQPEAQPHTQPQPQPQQQQEQRRKRSFTNAFCNNEQVLQTLGKKYRALLAKSERRKQARKDKLKQEQEEIDSFMTTISALEKKGSVSRGEEPGRGHGALIDGLRREYSTRVEALEAEKRKWEEEDEEEKKDLDAVWRVIRLLREQEEEEEEEE
ncbi:hypothetical protein QBC43DRAFT_317935 [Cladorrhinum sp. PSN259]|nr:hypothetical protein QBC43DRAFT_317935 [Cladorrhinum sp. PSN259]